MADYLMVIRGKGPLYNRKVADADKAFAAIVDALRDQGHIVQGSLYSGSGEEQADKALSEIRSKGIERFSRAEHR